MNQDCPAKQPPTWLLMAAIMAVVVLMSVCYPAIKSGLEHAPPLRFAGIRTLIAGAALLLFAALGGRPVWPHSRLVGWILPLGLVSTSFTYAFMFSSPAFTDAGVSSVLGNTQPLFILVLAAIYLREPLTLFKVLALATGFLGAATLALPLILRDEGIELKGAMLALGASFSAAWASVWMRKLRPGRDIVSLTGWQLAVGGVLLLSISMIIESGHTIQWSRKWMLILALLSIGGSATATILWFWCLQHIEAGKLAGWLFLVPVLGGLLSLVWFKEHPDGFQLAGMIIILGSLAMSCRQTASSKRSQKSRNPI